MMHDEKTERLRPLRDGTFSLSQNTKISDLILGSTLESSDVRLHIARLLTGVSPTWGGGTKGV